MQIIISKHAKERIDRYGLTEDLVKTAIREPDEVIEGYGGTLIAHKLLKIITVYPAEKVRYWGEK